MTYELSLANDRDRVPVLDSDVGEKTGPREEPSSCAMRGVAVVAVRSRASEDATTERTRPSSSKETSTGSTELRQHQVKSARRRDRDRRGQ